MFLDLSSTSCHPIHHADKHKPFRLKLGSQFYASWNSYGPNKWVRRSQGLLSRSETGGWLSQLSHQTGLKSQLLYCFNLGLLSGHQCLQMWCDQPSSVVSTYTCVCVYIKQENQNRPLQRNPQKYQVSLDEEAGKQTGTAQSHLQPEQDPERGLTTWGGGSTTKEAQ
jgi:hypothetical protein